MPDLADLVTVLVVTSPTASDPSTTTIDETIASIPNEFPIIIGLDGVRPEQRHLTADYHEKWMRLAVYENYGLPAWGHQANVMRALLLEVDTPLVLFMEGDTPLTPDVEIDWSACAETILSSELDLIRFLHESHILAEHEHLMIGEPRRSKAGIPYVRTSQWSQRPHLARTDWYRNLIDTYFGHSSRTMIEDVLFGVVQYHWQTYGNAGLDRFKLGIYFDPEPTYQRSYHLDGRAGGEKYEMLFAYDGPTPEGAPAPTLGRTFE